MANYNDTIKKAIEEFKEINENNAMYVDVAEDLLNCESEDLLQYMYDIINHGCISGIVNSQMYYSDTKKFFLKYYEEIFEVIALNEEYYATENLNFNKLSWCGYEYTVKEILEFIDKSF